MTIQRIFLGTDRPALHLVTDYLFGRFAQLGQADFRQVTLVLPGGRAGRRLLERLIDASKQQNARFTPPKILTVGQLPELLYQSKKPFADDLVQQLVWSETLQSFDPSALQQVIAELPSTASSDSYAWEHWLALGKLMQGLHRELASNALDFSDVVQQLDVWSQQNLAAAAVAAGATDPTIREKERWALFSQLQQAYLARLDRLDLWDRQTARRIAIDHHECHAAQPILLIGTVDLEGTLRQMLDQVSHQVTALIYAPAQWANRFDRHGCLEPATWQAVKLDLPDHQLIRADGPIDQAESVARQIASYQGRLRADQITVGLPDEQIVPQLTRQLDACKLPNRFGPGLTLAHSRVLRMLSDLSEWLATSSYEAFASLVRHPDIEMWLLATGVRPGWIDVLDAYYCDHLPAKIDGTWLKSEEKTQSLRTVYQRLAQLTTSLAPLRREPDGSTPDNTSSTSQPSERQSLDHHLAPIAQFLQDLYGQRTFQLDQEAERMNWQACSEVQQVLETLAAIPPSLMPQTTAAEGLQLIGRLLGKVQVPARSEKIPIELVGWLELPLDDAPALVVTSFNQPFVPTSIQADQFLPGTLRTVLGLEDNRRRYARDAYAVSTLLAPWRNTSWIVARRNTQGDPLAPSRLLFATSPEKVAQRAMQFFGPAKPATARTPMTGDLATSPNQATFEVPQPHSLAEPLTSMSVTSFAQYMACPYRFYLEYVLGLRQVHDRATELDGAAFGTLAHYVLEQFGTSEQRDACAVDKITKTLNQILDSRVRQLFGSHPRPAVQLQVEQLRLRLKKFSTWQANRRSEGWQIEHTELAFREQPAKLIVDGEPMQLTGRIDRIDFNEATGKRQILDYKTGDAGDEPKKTHRRRDTWIDLQLPLYRHLVRALEISGPVELAYIRLPKRIDLSVLAKANWSEAELESADEMAYKIVRQVREQKFWPPVKPAPRYSEDLASICMDGVFGITYVAT
jgi:ATP-dependent helicase/nuclease subunit B